MVRVKRAMAGRKKRNALAELSKGYYGTGSRTFRGMKVAGVELDRKVLAQIAYEDAEGFAALAEVAKKALAE